LYEMPFLNNNTLKPVVKIPKDKVASFKDLFDKMLKENSSSHSDKEEILRAYLNLLLLDSKRLFETQANPKQEKTSQRSEILQKFKILIEKHFFKLHKPGEYADLLYITPGHLNDTVNDMLGISASDLIQERIILEIKRMLLHSQESINEIAQTFNFDDPSYFARFFKNKTGSSPKEFREESRANYK
jgi:AraC family transcriptional activator of pobA